MRNPGQALVWELWRISRWDLIIRSAGGSVFWVVAFYFLRAGGDGFEPIAGFAFLMLVGAGVCSGMWLESFDNRHSGFCFRLGFSRPISTRLLVAGPMLYIAGTSVLCFLIPTILLRLLYEVPFPLLPTSALIATASACFVAAAWSSTNVVTTMLKLAVVGATFGGLIWLHGPPGVDVSLLTWQDWPTIFDFTVLHYSVLLLVFVCAVILTTFAVDRQRHGERLLLPGVGQVVHDLADRLPRWTGPWGTPVRAQLWFEMRRSGVKVSLIGLGASILAFLYISYVHLNSGPLRGKAAVMWLIALAICPFVYQVLGAEFLLGLKRRQGAVWLSAFDATQAMGNGTLIAVKLVVLATSVIVSWLAMACAAATQTLLWGAARDWMQIRESISPVVAHVHGPWWAVMAIILVVLCMSSSAMMIAFGLWLPRHSKVFGGAALVIFAHAWLAVWDAQNAHVFRPLWTAYGWFFSAALVTVCWITWRTSLRWGCLSPRLFVVALCLWATFFSASVTLYLKFVPDTVPVPLPLLALGLGMITVPLSSAAIAPLALASHRHR